MSNYGCRHILVQIYSRPWWNWFRKTYQTLCWKCDINMSDPANKIPTTSEEQ